jgi:galactose-1-phosphate uridylyltransferase
MEFIKTKNGFDIMVNDQLVGNIYKDEKRNYMFQIVAKLNFEIMGYRNEAASKTWKQTKQEIEKLYTNLMNINKHYGKEIIYS